MVFQSRGHFGDVAIMWNAANPMRVKRDYETVSIQIGDDAIFALIQVKYGQKAQAKQFGRASALGLRSFGYSKA